LTFKEKKKSFTNHAPN